MTEKRKGKAMARTRPMAQAIGPILIMMLVIDFVIILLKMKGH